MENACVREVAGVWKEMTQAVVEVVKTHAVTGSGPLGLLIADEHARLQVAVQTIAWVITERTQRMVACLARDLPMLAETELYRMPQEMQRTIDDTLQQIEEPLQEQEDTGVGGIPPSVSVAFSSVPVGQITELLASPLGGAFFAQSFGDLAVDMLRALRNALAIGLARGDSIPTVARVIQGILGGKRYQAERIVRSEFVRVGNQAALLVYDQNKSLLRGVQWSATLDARTCEFCASLDGRVWADPNKAMIPVISSHPLCRCSLVPVLKGSKELGISGRGPATRASFNGQVAATLTYPEWFATQSDAFQRQVLGPTRYSLYKTGQVSFKEFSGTRGVRPVRDVLAGLKK